MKRLYIHVPNPNCSLQIDEVLSTYQPRRAESGSISL